MKTKSKPSKGKSSGVVKPTTARTGAKTQSPPSTSQSVQTEKPKNAETERKDRLKKIKADLSVNHYIDQAYQSLIAEGIADPSQDQILTRFELLMTDIPEGSQKHAGGRPPDYQKSFCAQAKVMCNLGATDMELAEAFGVETRTIYRWKHEHPEFCQAMALGKEGPDDRVERSLYNRAVGYTFETEKISFNFGKAIRARTLEHVPPDPKAAAIWLTNRRKGTWAIRHEHTGADGKDLVPAGRYEISEAELLAIAASARKQRITVSKNTKKAKK